ncbi:methyltransferase [Saccharothrix texasensis]|uniref:Release factor glutamine methyltransferase n=1 Tax=Saccharothrix texasensis TaxID=103734 RepID=A0A3N1HI18_9PSEU|nr:methyltransferase [Saccharothrix texasensis]ROP42177.1 release factor glutamine methyltransferase [Saccharothrix texasensis]
MDRTFAEDVGDWLVAQADDLLQVGGTKQLMGLDWTVLPEVWPPDPATEVFTSALPFGPGTRFLEIGCGAGVTSVMAARNGCERVVAADINPAAVANTELNAETHGVGDRVEALTSDLFHEFAPTDVFDLIVSNPPLVRAREDRAYDRPIERSVFDPGYGIHQRFFDEVKPHLAEDGRIFMNTSDTMGDPKSIVALAVRMGFAVRKHHSNRIEIPGSLIGWTPAVAAAADEHGLVHIDSSIYEFQLI